MSHKKTVKKASTIFYSACDSCVEDSRSILSSYWVIVWKI